MLANPVAAGAPARIASTTLDLSLGDLKSKKLKDFLAYYNALPLEKGRDIPARSQLVPEDIGFVLGQLMLIDIYSPHALPEDCPPASSVSQTPLHFFRFRLVGTRIEDTWRERWQGRWVHEMQAGFRAATESCYEAVIQRRMPRVFRTILRKEGGEAIMDRVIVPFSEDGLSISHLVSVIDIDRKFAQFLNNQPAFLTDIL